ncbi:hypothetical protein SLS53_007536 [Cytospora paraplurivora]|uniref:Uncharacterized protein n=1 Tax=Cytospora paraplurivora TaxID=2898453 RepID=A0AAN9YCE1_9PEZI
MVPPRTYYDYLTPTNSHLLNVTLAGHFPPPTSSTTTSDEAGHWILPSISPSSSSSSSSLAPPRGPPLPQGHHLVYFPATHPTSALRPDGTDTDHWPGPPFTRRLWAGGSVHFNDALRLDGRRAVCVERVEDVRLKPAPATKDAAGGVHGGGEGERALAAGDKLFVDILRSYGSVAVDDDDAGAGAGRNGSDALEEVAASPAIIERRTLVFLPETRAQAATAAGERAPRPARKEVAAHHSVAVTASPPLLFRFSALSFNAHAIHLDPAYAAAVEGYRERLVHGPLLLVLMFSALRGALGGTGLAASGLVYRNLEPVYVDEEMRVCVSPGRTRWNVWVEGAGGRLCVKGSAQVS